MITPKTIYSTCITPIPDHTSTADQTGYSLQFHGYLHLLDCLFCLSVSVTVSSTQLKSALITHSIRMVVLAEWVHHYIYSVPAIYWQTCSASSHPLYVMSLCLSATTSINGSKLIILPVPWLRERTIHTSLFSVTTQIRHSAFDAFILLMHRTSPK